MKVLYFAWVRSQIGLSEEIVDLPDDVSTVSELLDWLRGRGPRHAEALHGHLRRAGRRKRGVRVARRASHGWRRSGLVSTGDRRVTPKSARMIRVQREDFDIAAEIASIVGSDHGIGAVVTFIGLVRDISGGESISDMTLEHYPGMTEKMLERIESEAMSRWPLSASLIVHRYGHLEPGDGIVLVITASPHREAAFEASEFLVDWLKTKAPFWKRETTPAGAKWVAARDSDDAAAARWTGEI